MGFWEIEDGEGRGGGGGAIIILNISIEAGRLLKTGG